MNQNSEHPTEKKNSETNEQEQSNNTSFDERDIEHFVTELQRIIHDPALGNGPPGYQARFARTISQLNAQRVDLREKKISHMEHHVSRNQLLKELDGLKQELEEAEGISAFKRFQILKNIAKIREAIVSQPDH